LGSFRSLKMSLHKISLEERKGELFIFSEAVLWSFFPIVTVLTYSALPSLASLAWSTLFAAMSFGALVLYRKTWRELLNPILWRYIFFIVLFLGVLFYYFFFTGLSKTTAGNAGIIALFEIFTSFLFFHVLRDETISRDHKLGALLMVVGAIIVLAPNFSSIKTGDFFILAATFCAPWGNLFQQRARKIASSESILFLRSILSVPILFVLAAALGASAPLDSVKSSLPFLIINGAVLLGFSKILWIEGIHRISVTKANALNSITPLLTLLLAWPILHEIPSAWQLFSLIPLLVGTLLLTNQIKIVSKSLLL